MLITIGLFSISIISSCAILYILGFLWFTDVRNRQGKALFVLGVIVCWWLTMNAVCMVVQPRYFPFAYTLTMLSVCAFPFATLWFCLHFTGSRLVHNRMLLSVMIALAALDAALLITNPLHRLFYIRFEYPLGQFGPFFWVHSTLSYIALILAFLAVVLYTSKRMRRRPALLFLVFLLIVPCILNILFNLRILNLPHDVTPIGFVGTFLLFAFSSYRSQLLRFRTTALASVFDSIGDRILIINTSDVIVDANDACKSLFAMLSHAAENKTADAFYTHLQGRTDDRGAALLNDIRAGNRDNGEFMYRSDQSEIMFTITRRPIQNGNKRTGYILTLADVSAYHTMIREINQQNERLTELKAVAESASTAKGNFLSSMSHEMRTPMNAIIGMADIAKQTQDVERMNYCVQRIGEASHHLLGLINDVLDMAKIEAGKLELAYHVFAVRDAVDQALSVIDYNSRQKRQALEVYVDDDACLYIHSDKQRLVQVITNLLSNAVKFTPERGMIELDAKRIRVEDGIAELEFTIRDNGIGIAKDQQERLFVPFSQADSGIARKYGGTGLGLAISKNIVDQMGGRLRLVSELGRGSAFSFTIRARIADNLPHTEAVEERERREDYSANRILLAEDIAVNQEILMALLEPTGIRIDCASNGNEAVRMFRDDPGYDLIFMDIQMPEKDGYDATREIRALEDPRARSVPIIAMTANVFREEIDRCLEAGMNGHIGKPINPADVMSAMRKEIRRNTR